MKLFRSFITASVAVAVSWPAAAVMPAAAQSTSSVYIVAVGDIACDPSPAGTPNAAAAYNNGAGTKDGCRHKAVGAAVIGAKPDEFWALGDNQYFDGTYAKYLESYDSAFGPLKGITRPIPGNHEWKDLTLPTKPGAGYFTYFGSAAHPESNGNYSFNTGDWHVLAINDNLCDGANPCGATSAMGLWIASDMAKAENQKPCTVAMWHHPLWSLGETHKGGYGPMVPVWNQLYGLGVDMVLTGHDHNYVRTNALGKASVDPADPTKVAPPTLDPKGMVEFVIGTGGVDTYAASAATAQVLAPYLAAYQVGKPSPGLFGAGGFHLESDRYTFSYLPAANSAPFTDSAGRTCRNATNGNPQDVVGTSTGSPTSALTVQKVTWAPTNTTVKMTSVSGGTFTPSTKGATNGDGAISYAVTSDGGSGCQVDAAKGVITYTDPGTCEVTATAAATAKYAEGTRVVAFTVTSAALLTQKVVWSPKNTSIPGSADVGGSFAPSEMANTDGDGSITYEVTSAGKSGCDVDATTGLITYSDIGQCEVTATASATKTYNAGHRAVVFTIASKGPQKKQDMTAVQPAAGPISGGNTIILIGHGFGDATKVVMGGATATFTVVSDSKISVVVPAGRQPGPVEIRVTVGPPLGAIVAPGGYTYSDTVVAAAAPVAATAAPTTSPQMELGNPVSARSLFGGLRVLSRSEAGHVSPTALRRSAASKPTSAPTVRARVRQAVALSIGSQSAGEIVTVRAIVRGRTVPIGAARVDDAGVVQLPAFSMSRPGVVVLELMASQTGKGGYLKVLVTK